MKTKYQLVHLTDITCPPPEMIRIAARTGYDSVALRTIPMGVEGEKPFDIAKDRKLFSEIKQAVRETGIEIDGIENTRIFDGVDIREYEPCLEAAAELGVRHVLSNIWTDDKAYYTEKFCELCELAENYGITVNLEFVTWSSVKNLQETKELLLASGKKNVGIIVDTLHFYRSRVNINELPELPPEWFVCAHLCDAGKEIPEERESLVHTGRAERLYPGEGAVPIRDIIMNIPNRNVIRGLEIPNLKRVAQMGYEAYAGQALKWAKRCMREDENEQI